MSLSLKINNLKVGYKRKVVLNEFKLNTISAGKVVALVGPNAAGKSTLLKAISGFIPSVGDISLGEFELKSLKLQDRAQMVGYMPQHVSNTAELTVFESLISALKASPLDEISGDLPEVRSKALDILDEMGLTHLALQPLSSLSGGQRQMASLAQAVVRNPKLLLLDEPTSALDLQFQVRVMKLIRNYADKGNIVLMVMHDLNLAARWVDELIIMSKGAIYAQGESPQVVTSTMLNEVYQVDARVEQCSLGSLQIMVEG